MKKDHENKKKSNREKKRRIKERQEQQRVDFERKRKEIIKKTGPSNQEIEKTLKLLLFNEYVNDNEVIGSIKFLIVEKKFDIYDACEKVVSLRKNNTLNKKSLVSIKAKKNLDQKLIKKNNSNANKNNFQKEKNKNEIFIKDNTVIKQLNLLFPDKIVYDLENKNSVLYSHIIKKCNAFNYTFEEFLSKLGFITYINNVEKVHNLAVEIEDILISPNPIIVDNNNYKTSSVIKFLLTSFEIKELKIASGYFFNSGLKLFKKEISDILNTGGNIQLNIGSLKDYFLAEERFNSGNQNIIFQNMDKKTAIEINTLKEKYNSRVNVKTFIDKFFHGKLYIGKGKSKSFVLMGSSNVSFMGMDGNLELNSLFLFENNSNELKKWDKWYNDFWDISQNVENLNPVLFGNLEFNNLNISPISVKTSTSKEIIELADKERKARVIFFEKLNPEIRILLGASDNYNLIENKIDKFDADYFLNYIVYIYKNHNGYKLAIECLQKNNAFYFLSNLENYEPILEKLKSYNKKEFTSYLRDNEIKWGRIEHRDNFDEKINDFLNA